MLDGSNTAAISGQHLSVRSRQRLIQKEVEKLQQEVYTEDNNEGSSGAMSVPTFEQSQDNEMSKIDEDVFSLSSNDSSNDRLSDNDVSSSSEDDLVEDHQVSPPSLLREQLAHWSTQFSISQSAVTALLKILQVHFPHLPADARSLLGTPRSGDAENVAGGQFCYFGIKKYLQVRAVSWRDHHLPIVKKMQEGFSSKLITLSVNIDGLPIHKSTNKQLWPILGKVDNCENNRPFVIGLYCGDRKPQNCHEFLRKFVEEVRELESDGFMSDSGDVFNFRISCIVADAPARSFVKAIKNHNAYFSCEKCNQEGTWQNRVIFPYSETENLRTEETFSSQCHSDHHTGTSPLQTLQIGISQVPLDYMHLVCLGVMRKFLHVWVNGAVQHKLCNRSVQTMSNRLVLLKSSVPSEFARKPRSLQNLAHWKATEYRLFLLYYGCVVLRRILPDEKYYHFMLFQCAIYILCSDFATNEFWRQYAIHLLTEFVKEIPTLYSRVLMVYNVHNLLHLADDVARFGRLDNFSAFPFENFMRHIKRMVRGPNKVLEQVSNRLAEVHGLNTQQSSGGNYADHNTYYSGTIKSVKWPGSEHCIVSVKPGNNCFLTKMGDIVLVHKIAFKKSKGHLMYCKLFQNKVAFFTYPCDSTKLGICKVQTLGEHEILLTISDFDRKCVLIPYCYSQNSGMLEADGFICIPFCSMESVH